MFITNVFDQGLYYEDGYVSFSDFAYHHQGSTSSQEQSLIEFQSTVFHETFFAEDDNFIVIFIFEGQLNGC